MLSDSNVWERCLSQDNFVQWFECVDAPPFLEGIHAQAHFWIGGIKDAISTTDGTMKKGRNVRMRGLQRIWRARTDVQRKGKKDGS
jgi:hypothetical protein